MDDSIPTSPGGEDFETLTMPHLEAVARFALSLTRDAADADDLVQETYLSALRGWGTFHPGSDPRRWLFTICRNSFVRLYHRRRAVVDSDDGDLDAMPAVIAHVRAMHDGLGNLFDQIDVRPAIERAINDLPEPHHTILALVDLQGHSYDEAAAILDVPTGTVRSRLFRARRLIQDALIAYAADLGIGGRTPRVAPDVTAPEHTGGHTST
jgi:RNA polymerase sigma-70 factor (ECF subfamily)